MTSETIRRTPTPVDAIADDHLARSAALDPILATEYGLAGHDRLLTDFSPDAVDERAALVRSTLAQLDAASPTDKPAVTATTQLVAFDVDAQRLRRLTPDEREYLESFRRTSGTGA